MTIIPTHQLLPPGSCDCHTHVFLDGRTFPLSSSRRYTPPPASIEMLSMLHSWLGIDRVVIVQPSVYGLDNTATLNALRELGPRRARGVAVIDAHTPNAVLDDMAAAGVRGVRVNLEIDGVRNPATASDQMLRIAARIAPRGWHVQVFASMPLLAACSDMLATLTVPLVFDHFAGAQGRLGEHQEGLGEVLSLLESGKAYVKLSAPYRCSSEPDYADMEPLTRRLIQANPDRILWGSDWPHPQPGTRANSADISPPFDVDLASTLGMLRNVEPDDAIQRKILVENPRRLYGFDA